MKKNDFEIQKVGIITMHKVHNFGSHLQAYALQESIKLLNKEVCLIDYKYPNKTHIKRNDGAFFSVIKKIIFFPYYIRNGFITFKQKRKFIKFENSFFNLTRLFESPKEIENAVFDIDLYLTGSDQVWNPRFACGDSVFMLSFVKSPYKKIAYGPSLAISKIPTEYYSDYKEYLSKYDRIGVRDNNTKKVLEDLLGYEVVKVADPVFLLSKNYWEKLTLKVKKSYPDKFIFIFILTYSFDPYPEVIDVINKVKENYKLPIVFFNVSLKRKIQVKPEINLLYADVEDFLWLIKNATFIITTSFHVTAFSIIFEKQFISLTNTKEKDSRIIDLCDDLSISNYSTLKDFNFEKISNINYSKVTPNVEKMVEFSKNFLKCSLGVENEFIRD